MILYQVAFKYVILRGIKFVNDLIQSYFYIMGTSEMVKKLWYFVLSLLSLYTLWLNIILHQ